MSGAQIIKALKIIIPLLLGVYLTWYFFSSMDENAWTAFVRSLKNANWWVVGVTMILGQAAYFFRAWRWKYQLEPMGFQTKFWSRYHALMMGYIINLTVPRAGEVSRAYMLQRFHPVPFSAGFGTIITERIIDVLLLFTYMGITILLLSDDISIILNQIKTEFGSEKSSSNLLIYLVIGGIFLSSLLFLIKSVRNKILGFLKTLAEGVLSVFKMKETAKFIGYTLLMWGNYFFMFWLTFFAFETTQQVPVEGVLCAFIAGGLSISITNGGIGTYPLVVAWVIDFFLKKEGIHTGKTDADALGMIIWLSQTVVLLIMGLVSFFYIPSKTATHDEN